MGENENASVSVPYWAVRVVFMSVQQKSLGCFGNLSVLLVVLW